MANCSHYNWCGFMRFIVSHLKEHLDFATEYINIMMSPFLIYYNAAYSHHHST
jgi:hypothetical protein